MGYFSNQDVFFPGTDKLMTEARNANYKLKSLKPKHKRLALRLCKILVWTCPMIYSREEYQKIANLIDTINDWHEEEQKRKAKKQQKTKEA